MEARHGFDPGIYGADVNRVFLNRKRAVLANTGIPGVRSMGLVVSNSRALTDVNLADEDTNSIQTDDANRVIQSNVAMHVTPHGGQKMQFQIDFSWKND